MSLVRQKKVAWCVFFAGAGTTLLFCLYAVMEGFRFVFDLLFWEIISVLMLVAGGWRLRVLYRREPAQEPGKWHLSVADLMALAGITGLFLAIAQSMLTPRVFLERGIAVCLLGGIANVLGLLIASRKGIQRPWHRVLFANAYSLRIFGALGTGTFFVLIFLTLSRDTFGRFMKAIIDGPDYPSSENGIIQAIRIGLVCLPLGLLGCWIVESKAKDDLR